MCYNWFPAAHFNNKIVHAQVLCTTPDISLLLTHKEKHCTADVNTKCFIACFSSLSEHKYLTI